MVPDTFIRSKGKVSIADAAIVQTPKLLKIATGD
jgi:hypothetical protein